MRAGVEDLDTRVVALEDEIGAGKSAVKTFRAAAAASAAKASESKAKAIAAAEELAKVTALRAQDKADFEWAEEEQARELVQAQAWNPEPPAQPSGSDSATVRVSLLAQSQVALSFLAIKQKTPYHSQHSLSCLSCGLG